MHFGFDMEKRSDFDTLYSRRGYDSIKWNRYPDNVLPLWVADMDFPTPEPIIQAIRGRLDHPFFGYGACAPEVIENICSWLDKRHSWHVNPEHVLLMPGVVAGFNWTVHSLLNTGDSFAFQTPVYPPFFKVADNANVQGIEVPLIKSKNQYIIDFDLMEKKIQSDTSLFLLCNPHNPVGRVFSSEELKNLGEFCIRHDMWICSDEIHSDLVFSGYKHVPIASLSNGLAQRTVTLMAPSKTFNIPGLHFSFAVVPNGKIREKMCNSKLGILGYPGLLANVAAGAAYSQGEAWLEELLVYLESNRDFTYKYFLSHIPEINVFQTEGTYLMWLDCSGLNLEVEPCEFFLEEAKVGLNQGSAFGKSGENFVRLNFGCPREILVDALEKMKAAYLKYLK